MSRCSLKARIFDCIFHPLVRQLLLGILIYLLSFTFAINDLHAQGQEVHHSGSDMEDGDDLGFMLNGLLMHDAWANVRGGNYRGTGIVGNLYLMALADTEKAGWWDGGKFALDSIAIYGRRPSLAVGDYQYTSSIDAFDTVELYQAYYQHSFNDTDATVLFGIHDYTTEFAVLNYGFALVNSSFFTPSTITQLPYSFYPYTGLGARVFTRLDDDYVVRVGAYDGKPASQRRGRGMDYGLSEQDGIYSIVEAGYEPKDEGSDFHGKYVAGAWQDSGDYTDINGVSRESNYGGYLLGEQEIWREEGTTSEGLGVFGQLSYSKPDRNFNSWYFGSGVRYQGLFDCRESDILALAYNIAETSSSVRTNNPSTDTAERVLELSYRALVTPSFTLTPDIQWVENPGANSTLNDSIILYLRSEFKL